MSEARRPASGNYDPILLIEAVLFLLLLGLFIALYVVPTQTRLSDVAWWAPVVLGGLSLLLLLVDTKRRKRRMRRDLQRTVDSDRGGAP